MGGIGWSGHVLTLPLAMLFPALWASSPGRATAAAVAAVYFLSASRGLPQGVASFFGASVWAGTLLWLVASLSFVLVHAVLWTVQPGHGKAMRYGIAAMLTAIPPFGIVGWAHPLTAAGVLFPGWGWWGLTATAIGLVGMTMRSWPAIALLASCLWAWSTASWTPPAIPTGWNGADTRLGVGLGRGDAYEQHRRLARLVRDRASAGARVVVLPESALGVLTPTVERFWTDALVGADVTVIAGAAALDTRSYDNVVAVLGKGGVTLRYRARMPVPVAMWQPWRAWLGTSGGARATFFSDPVIEVAGRRIAPLICYEQLLVWPILQSALHQPDTLVAIANGWWATNTSIPAIQHASVEAWSRLFALDLVSSSNS